MMNFEASVRIVEPSSFGSTTQRFKKYNVVVQQLNDIYYLKLISKIDKSVTKFLLSGNIGKLYMFSSTQGRFSFLLRDKQKLFQFSEISLNSIHSIVDIFKKIHENLKIDQSSAPLKPLQETSLRVTKRSEFPVTKSLSANLTRIFYTNLNLRAFDKRILGLLHLRELQITQNSFKTIPYELYNLSLQSLILYENKIEYLPELLGTEKICQSLKVLDLSSNQIVMLPENFWLLRNLVKANLSDNQMKCIPVAHLHKDHIVELVLAKNPIQLIPYAIFQYLRNFSNLQLDPNYQTLPEGISKIIGELDQKKSRILTLTNLSSKKVIEKRFHKKIMLTPSLFTKLNIYRVCCVCYKDCGIEPFRFLKDVTKDYLEKTSARIDCDQTVSTMNYVCSLNCSFKFLKSHWKYY